MRVLAPNMLVIQFTEEEAEWLRDLLQNPIYDDETPDEAKMRMPIFEGMKEYCGQFKRMIRTVPLITTETTYGSSTYNEDDIPF